MFYLSEVVQSLKGHVDLKLPRVDKDNMETVRKQTKEIIEQYLAKYFDSPNDVDGHYDVYYQFYLKFFDQQNENFTEESGKRKLTSSKRFNLGLKKSDNESEL